MKYVYMSNIQFHHSLHAVKEEERSEKWRIHVVKRIVPRFRRPRDTVKKEEKK